MFSNFVLYQESGYFSPNTDLFPLLHTWSLAVEEQYYLFFPLTLLFIAKFNSQPFFMVLSIIGITSFIICLVYTEHNSAAAFYLIPSRAWELMAGSLLALKKIPHPDKKASCEVISILGLLFILISIFSYTEETAFPGYAAMLPVLGTVLVILSGMQCQPLMNRLLSWKPVVFIGLISYSLYLWHWPVLVYTKIYTIKTPGIPTKLLMLLALLILSWASWKFIEQPFRRKHAFKSFKSLLLATIISSMIIIIFAIKIINLDGMPDRIPDDFRQDTQLNEEKWNRWGACEKYVQRQKKGLGLCSIGAEEGKPTFIIWGDSHARSLAPGIHMSTSKFKLRGKIASMSSCPPLLSIENTEKQECDKFNTRIMEYILANHDIEKVILSARWALYVTGERFKEETGPIIRFSNMLNNQDEMNNLEAISIGLDRIILKLVKTEKEVVIVNTIPEIGYDIQSAHFISALTNRDINNIIAPTLQEYQERNSEVYKIFKKYLMNDKVSLINIEDYLCSDTICSLTNKGKILYRDDDHLLPSGAEFIHQAFDNIFQI